MGAVLTAGLASQLTESATVPGSIISAEQAALYASNPNALIEPTARAALAPEVLTVLQEAMAAAIHPVFWVGAAVCVLALFICFLMPKRRAEAAQHEASEDCGETMLMAEQTTINARNQPSAEYDIR